MLSYCITIQTLNIVFHVSRTELSTDAVYANYIGPSVMTDANCEEFPICDDRITENDRCVIKIIGIHCRWTNDPNTSCLNGPFRPSLTRGPKGHCRSPEYNERVKKDLWT